MICMKYPLSRRKDPLVLFDKVYTRRGGNESTNFHFDTRLGASIPPAVLLLSRPELFQCAMSLEWGSDSHAQ